MSYRSIRIRALRPSRVSTFPGPKWLSTNHHLKRSYPPVTQVDREIANNLQQLQNVSRDTGGDRTSVRANREENQVKDEVSDFAREPRDEELSISYNLPTFHATYSSQGDSQKLQLPETPRYWGPRDNDGEIAGFRRRSILRSAFLEAASTRLHRRSGIISRAVKSGAKLKVLADLLYPYRRRHPHWERNFYILFGSRGTSQPDGHQSPRLRVSQFADEWSRDLFRDRDADKMTDRWQQLSCREKGLRWPHLMLKCLLGSTKQALNFLDITHIKPFPPFEMVMDALLYLRRVRGEEIRSSAELFHLYMQIMSRQLHPKRWVHCLERKHLDLMLEDCSGEKGKDLFEKLLDDEIELSYSCMLAFMDFFTGVGDTEMALKALNGTDPDLRSKSYPSLLSRCINLLKLDSITTDGESPNFRLLPQVLEAGVRPNLVLHNMILKNAVKQGAPGVAWDLFRYMQEQGLPTDARTYLILLQDTLARRDEAGLQEILAATNTRSDLSKNPHLIAYTLTVIRVVQGQDLKLSPRVLFSNMISVYNRAFSTAPLEHLRMVSEESSFISSQNRVQPDIDTVAYVVQSYVLAQQSTQVVQSLLDWIEHLRSQGDELALALTQRLPFYDGFIAFFARRSGTLPKCLQIVRSMLDRTIQPSTTTWGVVYYAFAKHGQFQAAEDVKNTMDRLGLDLNEKTTRLIMKLQTHAKPTEPGIPATHHLEESSRRTDLDRGMPFADARQDSESEGNMSVLEVDDTTPFYDSQQQNVSEGRRLSTRNHSERFGRKILDAVYNQQELQLDEEPATQNDRVGHKMQTTDELIPNAPIPNKYEHGNAKPYSPSGSFQREDVGEMIEKNLGLLLSESAPVTTSSARYAQQVKIDSPGPLLDPAFTFESNVTNSESLAQVHPVDSQLGVDQAKAEDTSPAKPKVSGLGFYRFDLGEENDQVSLVRARMKAIRDEKRAKIGEKGKMREALKAQEADRRNRIRDKQRAKNKKQRTKRKAIKKAKAQAPEDFNLFFTGMVFNNEDEIISKWARPMDARVRQWESKEEARNREGIKKQGHDVKQKVRESGVGESRSPQEEHDKSRPVPKALYNFSLGLPSGRDNRNRFRWSRMTFLRGKELESPDGHGRKKVEGPSESVSSPEREARDEQLRHEVGSQKIEHDEREPKAQASMAKEAGETKITYLKLRDTRGHVSVKRSVSRRDFARVKYLKGLLNNSSQSGMQQRGIDKHITAYSHSRRPSIDLSSKPSEGTNDDCYEVEPNENIVRKPFAYENNRILQHYKKFLELAETQTNGQKRLTPDGASRAPEDAGTQSQTSSSIRPDQRADTAISPVAPENPGINASKEKKNGNFQHLRYRRVDISLITGKAFNTTTPGGTSEPNIRYHSVR